MQQNNPDVEAPQNKLDPPGYPSVAGLTIPDLNLAGISTPKTDLAGTPAKRFATEEYQAGGNFSDSIPPQNLAVPALKLADLDTIKIMSFDPDVQYQEDFNFAGERGFPNPGQLVSASQGYSNAGNDPTFIMPNYDTPALKPGDLVGPGIDTPPAFTPDPQTGDLLQFCIPIGLDIHAASDMSATMLHEPDPIAPDLGEYDRPDGLVMPQPMTVDPALPNLQSPDFTQAVHIDMRPGELAPDALDVMHSRPSYKIAQETHYPESQMDIGGHNTTRRRKFALLTQGLDAEEGGKTL